MQKFGFDSCDYGNDYDGVSDGNGDGVVVVVVDDDDDDDDDGDGDVEGVSFKGADSI